MCVWIPKKNYRVFSFCVSFVLVSRMLFCLICFGFGFLIEASASEGFLPFNANTTATPMVKVIPEAVGNFIYYENFNTTTAKPFIDSITSFLSAYDNSNQAETLRYCDFNYQQPEDSACVFDKNSLGPCSVLKDYGYSDAKPCVFFTLSQASLINIRWFSVDDSYSKH